MLQHAQRPFQVPGAQAVRDQEQASPLDSAHGPDEGLFGGGFPIGEHQGELVQLTRQSAQQVVPRELDQQLGQAPVQGQVARPALLHHPVHRVVVVIGDEFLDFSVLFDMAQQGAGQVAFPRGLGRQQQMQSGWGGGQEVFQQMKQPPPRAAGQGAFASFLIPPGGGDGKPALQLAVEECGCVHQAPLAAMGEHQAVRCGE